MRNFAQITSSVWLQFPRENECTQLYWLLLVLISTVLSISAGFLVHFPVSTRRHIPQDSSVRLTLILPNVPRSAFEIPYWTSGPARLGAADTERSIPHFANIKDVVFVYFSLITKAIGEWRGVGVGLYGNWCMVSISDCHSNKLAYVMLSVIWFDESASTQHSLWTQHSPRMRHSKSQATTTLTWR
jgi:hypothetical protein